MVGVGWGGQHRDLAEQTQDPGPVGQSWGQGSVHKPLSSGLQPPTFSCWEKGDAAKTGVPGVSGIQTEAERTMTTMGHGRRQLICMLNIWK